MSFRMLRGLCGCARRSPRLLPRVLGHSSVRARTDLPVAEQGPGVRGDFRSVRSIVGVGANVIVERVDRQHSIFLSAERLTTGQLQRPPALDGGGEGALVEVVELAADGDALGEAGHLDV